jgi:hypothetical protein
MSMNAAVAQITEQELDVVMDIPVTLSLEVGRAQTNVRGLLQLRAGSIIELSKATSEAFDVFFNGGAWRSGRHQPTIRCAHDGADPHRRSPGLVQVPRHDQLADQIIGSTRETEAKTALNFKPGAGVVEHGKQLM